MIDVSEIAKQVPLWVVVLFGYMIWIGVRRLRTGVRDIRKVWIMPTLFIVWGVSGLFPTGVPVRDAIAHWIGGAVVGVALGALIPQPFQVDRARGLLLQHGSPVPLLRNLTIFGLHFVLRSLVASGVGNPLVLLAWDGTVAGAAAGFFLGWLLRLIVSYRRAEAIDLPSWDAASGRVAAQG